MYRWSDGSAADLLKWAPGEPNDFNHGQRCVDFYPWDGKITIFTLIIFINISALKCCYSVFCTHFYQSSSVYSKSTTNLVKFTFVFLKTRLNTCQYILVYR